MSRRARYTVEAKVRAAERYLRGEASAAAIAAELVMGRRGDRTVQEWAAAYRENGIEGFHLKKGNSSYTAEEKQEAVEAYIQGKGSQREIVGSIIFPAQKRSGNG